MIEGGLVEIDGEWHYRIDGVHEMSPFLMSVVSDGDRWMFVSSGGALTAGRRDATRALFPYVTDDRLHAAAGAGGPATLMRVDIGDRSVLWEPFSGHPPSGTGRSVAKTVVSDSVVFEERHPELDLSFRSRWSSADRFGFVRTATLSNRGRDPVSVDLVDGLVDVLPYGLEPIVYHRLSNLTNAYKRSEVVDDRVGLAVYTLEAPVSDQAEPEEVLRATTVWSVGLDGDLDVSGNALDDLRRGREGDVRRLATGVPGAHLRRARATLEPGTSLTWLIVGDVARDQNDVAELRRHLASMDDPAAELGDATRRTGERLAAIVVPADSEQMTGDPIASAHHLSNVIYNVMRGGVPLDGYRIDVSDLRDFVRVRNRSVAERNDAWFADLPDGVTRDEVVERADRRADAHLRRLVDEYLPFSFSRRHGDPSRPWNEFSIRVAGDDGAPIRYYAGNWRDVFQNWEALCASFPGYLPGVVSTFLDASTADGHNPYRITRDGIDWEEPDPDDPWANIGYWGDHQIVYLLRLLVATDAHFPGRLAAGLDERRYTYADVPYRIARYDELVADPKDTIEFDDAAAARAAERVRSIGADGRLLLDGDAPVLVTLAEKLVVPALAKLSNFVPDGGIWMNTQRPEWNDANNALVGHGISVVTAFHLRRYLEFLRDLVATRFPGGGELELSSGIAAWLDALVDALDRPVVGDGSDSDVARDRRTLLDALGAAASDHRATLYATGSVGVSTVVEVGSIVRLCDLALVHLDATIAASRRSDGLVHSYNLLRLPDAEHAMIEHLPEMLEGQVAALTPGVLTPRAQADLLDALFESALHRADLDTFRLAPVDPPPGFLEKNVVEPSSVERSGLLSALVEADEGSIIHRDVDGRLRFAPELTTADALDQRLVELATDERWSELVERHRDDTLATYEEVFGHHGHLGRSGTMYGYEGIGSVYWHMVAKLLLATQEAAADAERDGSDDGSRSRLVEAYWRIRAGLGVNASAERFGAIPIDPYSHSPSHAGAQQPGMTGAVKEEILARRRELGVRVEGGHLVVDDLLLRRDDLLDESRTWAVRTVDGSERIVELGPGSVGCTVCQVAVVVTATDDPAAVEVEFADGRVRRVDGDRLDAEATAAIFRRTGEIAVVRATVAHR